LGSWFDDQGIRQCGIRNQVIGYLERRMRGREIASLAYGKLREFVVDKLLAMTADW